MAVAEQQGPTGALVGASLPHGSGLGLNCRILEKPGVALRAVPVSLLLQEGPSWDQQAACAFLREAGSCVQQC